MLRYFERLKKSQRKAGENISVRTEKCFENKTEKNIWQFKQFSERLQNNLEKRPPMGKIQDGLGGERNVKAFFWKTTTKQVCFHGISWTCVLDRVSHRVTLVFTASPKSVQILCPPSHHWVTRKWAALWPPCQSCPSCHLSPPTIPTQ